MSSRRHKTSRSGVAAPGDTTGSRGFPFLAQCEMYKPSEELDILLPESLTLLLTLLQLVLVVLKLLVHVKHVRLERLHVRFAGFAAQAERCEHQGADRDDQGRQRNRISVHRAWITLSRDDRGLRELLCEPRNDHHDLF